MIIQALVSRVSRALRTAPRWRDWAESALAAAFAAMVLAPIGFATGLLHWAPRPAEALPALMLSAIFIPALGEEIPFRALAIPDRAEAPHATLAIALSTVVFVLWHVAQTLFLPRAAPIFLRSDFLGWVAIFGLICAILRRRSGSIWPAVALHWAVVVVWQQWLGGPSVEQLR